jgi:hypothetical protein
MKKASRLLLAVLALIVGLYPLIYLVLDSRFGLLRSKPEALLQDPLWSVAFYVHIMLGGLALLTGWPQFSFQLRTGYPMLHRRLGQVYVVSVLFSALAGFYLGFYATGGWIASAGFVTLSLVWLGTTLLAFTSIRRRQVMAHQGWMMYSYAACCAAITLRIWLPLLTIGFGDFYKAYRLVAWLCWVPNMLVAYSLANRAKKNPAM